MLSLIKVHLHSTGKETNDQNKESSMGNHSHTEYGFTSHLHLIWFLLCQTLADYHCKAGELNGLNGVPTNLPIKPSSWDLKGWEVAGKLCSGLAGMMYKPNQFNGQIFIS